MKHNNYYRHTVTFAEALVWIAGIFAVKEIIVQTLKRSSKEKKEEK